MGEHLEDYESRFTKRSISNKERTKSNKFANAEIPGEEIFVDAVGDESRAIVVEGNRGRFRVFFNDKILSDVKMRRDIDFKYSRFIVSGDRVGVVDDGSGYCISSIQKRTSKLSRMRRDNTRTNANPAECEHVIAANIDAAVAVISARNPPFHAKVIDRYLIMIQSSNIEPIICMNKSDLAEGHEDGLLKEYERLGIKCVKTSTVKNEGIENLKELLSGKTVVFIGHSGVGKSSLINAISGNLIAKEGKVSEKTGKGKHTTTSSVLYKWKENSFIIDTPGIRAFGMWGISKDELHLYFPEFDKYKTFCKYDNCLHNHEKEADCGVKQALSKGELSKNRYDSYVRILEEL
ncbi:MAG: ribosome small subunit-dependent GTPase A [Candidatus Aenigmatarchaeota archaeon]